MVGAAGRWLAVIKRFSTYLTQLLLPLSGCAALLTALSHLGASSPHPRAHTPHSPHAVPPRPAATPRDETTVLAFTGLSKVLRAHLPTVYTMEGFEEKWDELMTIAGKVLAAGRRSVAVAAAQLLTSVLQVRAARPAGPSEWDRSA